MSSTTENFLTKTYRGKFGKQMVFRNRGDVSILAKPPRKTKKVPTAAQLEIRRKFKLAARWAKEAMQDPDKFALYSAKASGMMTPYVVAMSDYLKPPVVHRIDPEDYQGSAGDRILVIASDYTRITGLTLKISDAAGNVIEEGPCEEASNLDHWAYTATQDVSSLSGLVISATATDVPGHTGTLSKTL
ncbi:MAG TPA: hypothetical protein PKG48_00990 [Bacteroidales bacterium]|nr:hypothetical protein [Bacteroidales bacterium]HPS61519.1 hypothetical protein [Bacteroidales bacterium]